MPKRLRGNVLMPLLFHRPLLSYPLGNRRVFFYYSIMCATSLSQVTRRPTRASPREKHPIMTKGIAMRRAPRHDKSIAMRRAFRHDERASRHLPRKRKIQSKKHSRYEYCHTNIKYAISIDYLNSGFPPSRE